ncbi:carbamoyl-phosphate synthase large subunit [Aeromicrobium sp. PE09-221]|uniref:carboxyl transferase domain-containing protein n=1 Tax=Aeromicrobium sp. PE09-221 TaxID=1898043 RepID=UPI000B3E7798|nr:carboxyl transferase domain-containing protein [Aeromicrobium sp. PE09-221]OUZ08659.1 carbamoyl-phosphate synthase large subunit [Aeromicrobium sp. PE09-221]
MRVLIANRGEIAARIGRALDELGWAAQPVHARGEAPQTPGSAELPGHGITAYLDVEGIIDTAIATGCDALHPGYGFLSESPELARACESAGLIFVGPSPSILSLFGDKGTARDHAVSLGLPVMAATGASATLEDVTELFSTYRDGIMIKATSGGGGRGMREVYRAEDLAEAYESCRSEARRAFGGDTVYAERLMTDAKHIEIQVLGDGTGAVSILGERECSVQRRHQKILEFAPSPSLNDAERALLSDHARRLIAPLGYRGLATVEFLVSTASLGSADGSGLDLAFIEVNPRVQVEHTVTEEVVGVDLVAAQLRVATGTTLVELGLAEDRLPAAGVFAIQSRVNAERIHAGASVATTGTVTELAWPEGIRVDTYLREGTVVDGTFDSLLAKVITRTEGSWREACADALTAVDHLTIRGIETNTPLLRRLLTDPQVLAGSVTTAHLDAWLAREAEAQAPAGGDTHLISPLPGTVVAIGAAPGDVIGTRTAAITLEAMKMEHPVRPTTPSVLTELLVKVGDQVAPGEVLAILSPAHEHVENDDTGAGVDLDYVRPDLAELQERKRLTLDDARPEAVAKRHAHGHLMAREWIDQLLDGDSFVEYGSFPVAAQRSRRSLDDLVVNTPADGILTGLGRVNGQQIGVLAYDYTVLAGTQGYFNHKKTDRLLGIAKDKRIPVVFFAEGGGGRPGDTDTELTLAAGLNVQTFAMMGSLSGVVPSVGILTGRCFAGNAALLGSCDVIIATADANVGMAGPAMIEGGGLGNYRPEDIGPMSVQAPNGVVDVLVEDDAEAIETAQRYLSYFSGETAEWTATDQRRLRHVVGENRKQVYDQRELISILADDDSVLELRRDFGIGAITALVRVEGRPMGLVANNPVHLGGAIDADAADKMARFLQLCDAHGLPVVSLCDTPGFMVGPDSEETATVRHFGRLFVIGAHLRVPMITVILRKAYGLGAQAMAAGSFARTAATIAWPTGEIGGMGLEGAVRLGFAKELDGIADPEAKERRYNELLDAHYETGKAINGAMKHEFDEVIDPLDTRRWITAVIGDWVPGTIPGGRYVDTW